MANIAEIYMFYKGFAGPSWKWGLLVAGTFFLLHGLSCERKTPKIARFYYITGVILGGIGVLI